MRKLLLLLSLITFLESYSFVRLTISATVVDSESVIADSVFDNIHIDSLTITNCSIKSLPDKISHFKNLKYLNLSGCVNLNQVFLDSLKSLVVLKLNHTHISEFPFAICRLTSLRFLDLSKTYIKKIPEELGQLSQLEFLKLNNTYLQALPVSIGKLIKLEELWLINTKIDYLPLELAQITTLKFLWVYWTDIENRTDVIREIRAVNETIFFGHSNVEF